MLSRGNVLLNSIKEYPWLALLLLGAIFILFYRVTKGRT
jgi:hypothetical protein